MRCVAYCIAEGLDLITLQDYFKKQGFENKLYRGVLYISHPKNRAELFFFKSGCFVAWGMFKSEEKLLLKSLKKFSKRPLSHIEVDYFSYHYGKKTDLSTHRKFNVDVIELENDDVPIKLAISYGLSQSVKLESYEESVQKTIRQNSRLPEELAQFGKISLSGKAILKRIGEIYLERSLVNLSSEYLDVPEYFWQSPHFESYYAMTEKFLDIARRVNSLNQRLNVLHELLDVLNSQLQHKHSSILEIIIILLIFFEIILNLIALHF
jgi:uncharacterized Rmd1/YagE family protein